MKKDSVSVSYDDEKLSALKIYLEQRGTTIEEELTQALDSIYAKNVPAGVRSYLMMRSGESVSADKRKRRIQDPEMQPEESKTPPELEKRL